MDDMRRPHTMALLILAFLGGILTILSPVRRHWHSQVFSTAPRHKPNPRKSRAANAPTLIGETPCAARLCAP